MGIRGWGRYWRLIVNGRYYWIPWQRIPEVAAGKAQRPARLRLDACQLRPGQRREDRGLDTETLPGLEGAAPIHTCNWARKTEWLEHHGDTFVGIGQRMLVTDQKEYALMDMRQMELNTPEARPRRAMPQRWPELTHKERLQPSLLDRLTDDEPDKSRSRGTSEASP